MPTISMFYGILVAMYYMDNQKHHHPHIHAKYGDYQIAVSIPEGEVLEGKFPPKQLKLLQAWIAIHEDELMADWSLAIVGEQPYKIEPLR